MRPEAISNLIRLTYEFRALMWSFVSEDRAVNTLLSAVVDEVSPDKDCISESSPENDFLSGSDELGTSSAIRVVVATVVPLIHSDAVKVSVLR